MLIVLFFCNHDNYVLLIVIAALVWNYAYNFSYIIWGLQNILDRTARDDAGYEVS